MRYVCMVPLVVAFSAMANAQSAPPPNVPWIWNSTLWAPVGTGTTPGGIPAVPMPVSGTFTATTGGATNYTPTTQSVTAQDAASTSVTQANGQVLWSGTPTSGSSASFALPNGYGTWRVQVTGTWTGTLATEVSMDGGTTWVAKGLHQIGTPQAGASSYTGNFTSEGAIAGATNIRVRATATWTGTATIRVIATIVDEQVYLGNPVINANPAGGATPGHILSAASNNSTSIKGSAGTLYELTYLQTTTTLMDIRLYDTASAPTCSSATGVVNNYVVQSNVISAGATINMGPVGKKFVNGIGICITGANADNDNTNAVTGLNVNYSYN